ncbi:Pentatricopeptide repeat-containing protein -chloroplastic [Striga hermonthica]|uniref:Pentatricopeptide repeat-containing protein -chloroplastic n=1 Tax=Striga hermonthica TaxID=68872 RepID=A0A9N7N6M7_STRHE|nr:Pentatricopeptide repeat-containing protein -chloroplastic [Striga hermonthica]
MPFPLISILFLNLNSGPVKADSSACSSPVLEPVQNAPLIDQLAVNLQKFPTDDGFSDDNKDWNSRIIGLFKDPQTESLGYETYQKSKQKPGFKPLRRTLKLVSRYLIRSKNWSALFSFCEDLKIFQVLPDRPTCCRLIIGPCVKARKFKLVDSFLDVFLANDKETAVLAFDSAMKGYNQLHMYSSTCALHKRMISGGLDFGPACYCHVMEAHMKMGHFEKACSVFQEFENRKFVDTIGDEKLLPVYSRIYWILCESLGKLGRAYEALEHFREMSRTGIPENNLIYSSLISSFASAGEVKMAEELMLEAESKNMLKDPSLFLKLILRYIDEGLMEKTLDSVELMKRVNIRVSDCIFCAIVNGFSKKRGLRAGVRVFEDLISRGCNPGQVTYASVLNMYLRLGLYSKGEKVFSEMERKGYHNCVVAYSSLVAAYCKAGKVREAMRLVAKMKQRGIEPNREDAKDDDGDDELMMNMNLYSQPNRNKLFTELQEPTT